MPQPATPAPRRPRTVRRVALLLAGILVLSAGAWYAGIGRTTPEKLYDAQFRPPRAEVLQAATPIAAAYREERYAEVIRLAAAGDTLVAADSLLAGIAYLQLHQPQRGAYWLAAQLPAGTYRQDARYYLALAHLREKRLEEAERIFLSIAADPVHPYQSRVTPAFLEQLAALKQP